MADLRPGSPARHVADLLAADQTRRDARKRKRPPVQREAADQRTLAEYLDRLRVLWCHVGNEGQRSPIRGAIGKRMGAKAGVPDVLIFSRPPRVPDARGAAWELKAAGGRVTPEQAAWLDDLRRLGWLAGSGTLDEALAWLRGLGW